MNARVARWEGAEGEALRASAAEISSTAGSGPPPGVPADLRKGDATLNSMSPSRDDVGKRTSVENYEVAVDVRI